MKDTKTGRGGWLSVVTAMLLLIPVAGAWGQWELDATESSLNFVSIKNDALAEIHSFSSLRGTIGSDGKVQLTIALDSVETLIEIRNERMRELLFETVKFPLATITAALDRDLLAELGKGGTVAVDLPVTLSLHGVEKTLNVSVVAIGQGGGTFRVFTPSPVIVNAADFGLGAGVTALQTVAGLQAISSAVPVTLHLVFSAD